MSDDLHDDAMFLTSIAGWCSRGPNHEVVTRYTQGAETSVWTVELIERGPRFPAMRAAFYHDFRTGTRKVGIGDTPYKAFQAALREQVKV